MKQLLAIIGSAAVAGVAMATVDGFTTTLDIDGFADSTRVVARIHDDGRDGGFRFDTLYLINGHAELLDSSRVAEPTLMYLFTPGGTITAMVQNGHDEHISGNIADIKNVALTFEGAPWSGDIMDYNSRIGSRRDALNNQARNFGKMSAEQRDTLFVQMKEVDSLELRYYAGHPNSWIVLYMMQYRMMDMPRADVEAVLEALLPEQRASRYGATIGRYLSFRTINVGDSLADFNIIATDQNGNHTDLSKITEPYILLDFSQTYCGPCISAAKEIHEIKEKYAGKVAFVNYSCDNGEADWRVALERDNPDWPSLFDGTGPFGDVCMSYAINSYPTFFVFGPDRRLLDRREGYGPGMLDMYISGFIENCK